MNTREAAGEADPASRRAAAVLPDPSMEFLRTMLLDRAGLLLGPDKGYLIESRLGAVAGRHGFAGAVELIDRLRTRDDAALRDEAVEAMTIRETSFLRDAHPFAAFGRTILPELLGSRDPTAPVSVWSAGCSTGQEPYSLAMTALESERAATQAGRVRILATDISRDAIDRARAGRYSQIEVNRGLPARWLLAWFGRSGVRWTLRDEIRDLVRCFTSNLIRQPPPLPRFDVIFARYVLMYLHMEARLAVLERFRRCLEPGGLLFVGATETLLGCGEGFEPIRIDGSICYRARARRHQGGPT